MKLIENANDWYKFWSVRLSVIGATILTIIEGFPNEVHVFVQNLPTFVTGSVDEGVLKAVGIIFVLGSVIARVIKQNKLDKPSEPPAQN